MKLRTLLIPLLLTLSSTPLFAQISQENLNETNAITIEQINPLEQENYQYDFGSVAVNTGAAAYFTVTNNSTQNWTFKSGTIAGDYFYGGHNCIGGLKPKEQCEVEIYYYPETTGDHEGAFELSFNPDLVIHVDLMGNAY